MLRMCVCMYVCMYVHHMALLRAYRPCVCECIDSCTCVARAFLCADGRFHVRVHVCARMYMYVTSLSSSFVAPCGVYICVCVPMPVRLLICAYRVSRVYTFLDSQVESYFYMRFMSACVYTFLV